MSVNRNIVMMREGDKLLFPTWERKEVDAPDNTPSKQFLMCRIESYDPHFGKMTLRPHTDNIGFDSYKVSTEVNSEFLSTLFITEVVFVGQRFINPVLNKTLPQDTFGTNYRNRLLQENENKPEPVRLNIELPVKNLNFLDGKVSFEHRIQAVGKKVVFEIQNPFIKKEHDAVKNYFPQALKADKFAILIEFEYLGSEILNAKCSSSHITKIDATLFEIVEEMYIDDYIVNNGTEDIYSLQDLAFAAAQKTGSEKMLDTDMLLNKIITPERTKHYYHLRYLSAKHVANNVNIHVTGKPLSFIFLLTQDNNHYLIWETYSTEEATYIWKIPDLKISQLESELNKYIEIIKWLRRSNKKTYLNTKPENFKRVEHEYAGKDMGYKKWRSQLDEFILGSC